MRNEFLEQCEILIKKLKEDIDSGEIKLSEKSKKEYENIMKNIDLNK